MNNLILEASRIRLVIGGPNLFAFPYTTSICNCATLSKWMKIHFAFTNWSGHQKCPESVLKKNGLRNSKMKRLILFENIRKRLIMMFNMFDYGQ